MGTPIFDNYKKNKVEKILENQKDKITGLVDITGDDDPTLLFYILADKLGHLLDDDPEKVLSKEGMEKRKTIHKLIKKLGPSFLSNKQVFENRNTLINPDDKTPDKGIVLPDEPVIWGPNHFFKDDALASVLAAKRDAYILFGSLPQFYNTFDGLLAWLVGVVLVNRKVASSKKASLEKCKKALELGSDLIIYQEGVWCKSPNQLMLDLWSGAYRVAKETGTKIVPIVHYIKDCEKKYKGNNIHTVIDDPISVEGMSEKAALQHIRDVMCTWYYLMMEQYGKTTREEELKGFNNSKEAWESKLQKRTEIVTRMDSSIELTADYRPKTKLTPDQVWESIANITNITADNVNQIQEAKKLVKEFKENDFQRRF